MTLSANIVDLTTVAAVQAYAQTQSTSIAATADQYQSLITAVSRFVANYCSRTFCQQTYTNERRNGRGTSRLYLKNHPIQSVSSLSVDGVTISPATGTPYSNGYSFDTQSLYLYGGTLFSCGMQNIAVSYVAGYVTPGMNVLDPITYPTVTLPQDLQQACNEAVADRFSRRANIGIRARALASETVSYSADAVPAAALETIKLYERKVLIL